MTHEQADKLPDTNRCHGIIPSGYNKGLRCPYRINTKLGNAESPSIFCSHHHRAHQNAGRPTPPPRERTAYEKLDEMDGPAHVRVAKVLAEYGCEIIASSAGWPDLLIKKNGRLTAVEIKRDDDLSTDQRRVVSELKSVLPTFVCRIPDGVRRWDGEVSFDDLLSHLEVETWKPDYFGA